MVTKTLSNSFAAFSGVGQNLNLWGSWFSRARHSDLYGGTGELNLKLQSSKIYCGIPTVLSFDHAPLQQGSVVV
jgi:hypothetical protein